MASDPLVDSLVGGLLQAAGVLIILLGGLCTGWLVLPGTAELWENHGPLVTLYELWLPLAGGAMTVVVGILLARAGLRRSRGGRAGRSGGETQ